MTWPQIKYKRLEPGYYQAYLTLENNTVHRVAAIYQALPSNGGTEWIITDWPAHVGFGLGGANRRNRGIERRRLLADIKQLLVKRLQARRKHGWINSLGY